MKTIEETKDLVPYEKHYSENAFWEKMRKFAKRAGLKVVYAALVLFYVLKSPNVSKRDKTIIIGALGYFILPIDLVPDFIPLAGYVDDLSGLLLAAYHVGGNITPEIKEQAKGKLHDWFGNYDEAKLKEIL